MKLSELKTGEKGIIVKVLGHGGFRKRIVEMGFIKGKEVEVIRNAPLKDPVEYKILGSEIALHRQEAAIIEVVTENEQASLVTFHEPINNYIQLENNGEVIVKEEKKTITVALVGNPNCGKTSIYNLASNSNAHVGNYTGVTVDAEKTSFTFEGYNIQIVDLPGTYSLSAYSPEELYVRKYIVEETPDIIVNVIDAANIERNLYLTTQLIDMNVRMVVALNMYDELEKKGDKLDYVQLSKLLGVPMIPTVGKDGLGIKHLFHLVIAIFEKGDYLEGDKSLNSVILRELKDWHKGFEQEHEVNSQTSSCFTASCDTCPQKSGIKLKQIYHHIHINHAPDIEQGINEIKKAVSANESIRFRYSTRYLAIKLLEKDKEIEKIISDLPNANEITTIRNKAGNRLLKEYKEDTESLIINAKYAFISGALKEAFTENTGQRKNITDKIDAVLTHRIWGYPIFLFFVFIMFQATFVIGGYPQKWIESLVGKLGGFIQESMPAGIMNDLIVDGILGGVGSVLVFLPNILILYFFISLMEDSGYMARAAFIMDKIMHKMGLHGRSFIPLIMGFGCTVPAIIATRTIEDKKNRYITILITPFISCTACLPIYILLTGAFFASYAGLVLFGIYIFGVLVAALAARILSKTILKGDDIPFVIELPPYRIPTLLTITQHTWSKGVQYLKKLGSVILFASLIIWALGYFPRGEKEQTIAEQQENSYIGRIGKAVEPVMKPLGFDWKLSVGLLSGMGAKELVVSTLGVLYAGDADVQNETLAERIPISPLVALGYIVFVLLYFPCIASIAAIRQETNWRWAAFAALYTTAIAWIFSFTIYQIGSLII